MLSLRFGVRLVRSLRHMSNSTSTHFGFETVSVEEKGRKVYDVFHKVANKYDLMNDAMSCGVHRVWKDIFVDELGPCEGTKILDVAGGTGDIAFRCLEYLKNRREHGEIIVLDVNKEMLRVGEERADKLNLKNIKWIQGDAQKLPFENNTFTAYSIAFGIRNVTHIDQALKEAYRVLKPGGRFVCLEFSRVENNALRWLYDRYSFQVIPALGQVIAGDWKSYQYLVESIRQFPDQENFKNMIQDAGFSHASYTNMTFGVVAIHSGFKL